MAEQFVTIGAGRGGRTRLMAGAEALMVLASAMGGRSVTIVRPDAATARALFAGSREAWEAHLAGLAALASLDGLGHG